MRAAAVATAVVAAASLGPARAVHAYGFSVHTRIIAQAYDLRSFRLSGADLWLGRRRYTQTLALDLIDLGDFAADRRKQHKHDGLTISFSSYLRVDHDFGDWTQGSVLSGTRSIDAIDLVPELGASNLGLDLLYAYLDVKGLADGKVDLRLGRQLRVDALDWFAMDGLTARAETPLHVAVEAFGGLRVRDASPLGTYQVELDGTSGADCREYVEGESTKGVFTPGLGNGSWQLIDRTSALSDHPRVDDTGYCPQRDQLMPTYGAALETTGLHGVYARVMYRRSESRSVGLLGPDDRLQPTYGLDRGFYPNEWGQAPRWGVNEERVAGTVRGNLDWAGGRAQASPWVAVRYSLLNALVDQAEAGVRLRWHDHAIEPEVGYYVPTFDGDSIFNVFAIEPSTEARLSWSWAPRGGWLRASSSLWARQFKHDDRDRGTKTPATGDSVAGFTATGEAQLADAWVVRLDGFSDNGYGGLRSGGAGALRWKYNPRLNATARGTVMYVATDSTSPNLRAVTSALQLGGHWQLGDGVAVHGVLETSYDRYVRPDVRALAILDLAFAPEM
jgi:hypothetical protein